MATPLAIPRNSYDTARFSTSENTKVVNPWLSFDSVTVGGVMVWLSNETSVASRKILIDNSIDYDYRYMLVQAYSLNSLLNVSI